MTDPRQKRQWKDPVFSDLLIEITNRAAGYILIVYWVLLCNLRDKNDNLLNSATISSAWKRHTGTFATRMILQDFGRTWHISESLYILEHRKSKRCTKFLVPLIKVLFAKLHLLQTKEYYVWLKPDLPCSSSAFFQPSRTAIIMAALDPVGFSLSGTMSVFLLHWDNSSV